MNRRSRTVAVAKAPMHKGTRKTSAEKKEGLVRASEKNQTKTSIRISWKLHTLISGRRNRFRAKQKAGYNVHI